MTANSMGGLTVTNAKMDFMSKNRRGTAQGPALMVNPGLLGIPQINHRKASLPIITGLNSDHFGDESDDEFTSEALLTAARLGRYFDPWRAIDYQKPLTFAWKSVLS